MQVDFQLSPVENALRDLTFWQINELYAMPEGERSRIINEHLAPKQRLEAELSFDAIASFDARLEAVKAKQVPVLPPTYDKAKRQITFCSEIIQIPADTDQEELCKALFRNGKPAKKPLDIGDALEKLGVPLDSIKGNKKISYAKREINTRVGVQTKINDLLVINGKQIWFNENYV